MTNFIKEILWTSSLLHTEKNCWCISLWLCGLRLKAIPWKSLLEAKIMKYNLDVRSVCVQAKAYVAMLFHHILINKTTTNYNFLISSCWTTSRFKCDWKRSKGICYENIQKIYANRNMMLMATNFLSNLLHTNR